jgi:hypothetical protein
MVSMRAPAWSPERGMTAERAALTLPGMVAAKA